MINGRVYRLYRKPQAVFSGKFVLAHFYEDNIRFKASVLADEAVKVCKRAWQIIGASLIGCQSDIARGKNGIGHHPILKPFFNVGNRPLQEQMDHL